MYWTDLRRIFRIGKHMGAWDNQSDIRFAIVQGTLLWQKATIIFGRGLIKKGKGSPYSITERRVPELIPVLGSQPAGVVSHRW